MAEERAKERKRETLEQPLDLELLRSREADGWRVVAIEWERPATAGRAATLQPTEVPYGLKIADDCKHLVEDPDEVEAMTLMLELITRDLPLDAVAHALNQRGHATRAGTPWSQVSVFRLLPRLIETGPAILGSSRWASLRQEERRRLATVDAETGAD